MLELYACGEAAKVELRGRRLSISFTYGRGATFGGSVIRAAGLASG